MYSQKEQFYILSGGGGIDLQPWSDPANLQTNRVHAYLLPEFKNAQITNN